MRPSARMLPLALALLAAGPAVLAADAAADDTRARLDAGEVIVTSTRIKGSATPKVKAMGVVDAPGEKIWPLIDKCGDYARTMIRTAASKELSRNGNKVRCTTTVELPFPLPNLTGVTDGVHTVQPGKRWERAWTLVEGDYLVNDGRWLLLPYGDDGKRTLLVYEVHAEPKVPVPDSIQQAAQKKSLPRLINHVRETVARM